MYNKYLSNKEKYLYLASGGYIDLTNMYTIYENRQNVPHLLKFISEDEKN